MEQTRFPWFWLIFLLCGVVSAIVAYDLFSSPSVKGIVIAYKNGIVIVYKLDVYGVKQTDNHIGTIHIKFRRKIM